MRSPAPGPGVWCGTDAVPLPLTHVPDCGSSCTRRLEFASRTVNLIQQAEYPVHFGACHLVAEAWDPFFEWLCYSELRTFAGFLPVAASWAGRTRFLELSFAMRVDSSCNSETARLLQDTCSHRQRTKEISAARSGVAEMGDRPQQRVAC